MRNRLGISALVLGVLVVIALLLFIPRATAPFQPVPTAGTGVAAQVTAAVTAPENTAVAATGTIAAEQNTAVPPTRSGPTQVPTLAPGMFVNPVLNYDFPDPDILKVGDTYYAYATNAGPTNIQAARSQDLVHWESLSGALPALPLWARAQAGLTWAPDVTTGADSKTYVMYYVTRDEASDKQCIGVATSDMPDGAFRSTGAANEKPFICQSTEGGSIDPASFTDEDGSRYILWKNDGNCCGVETRIYIQKVSADGLQLEGEPTRLIKNDAVWEGNLVEGPTLWKQNGKYYLFYSANAYNTERYAVGYAVADSILGPYRKADKPILVTDMQNGAAFGPGGQDVVLDKDGDTWMVYHSWDPTVSLRWMQIDPLVWEGDAPRVKGPSRMPEPVP